DATPPSCRRGEFSLPRTLLPCQAGSMNDSAADLAIRLRRATFNRALAEADLDAIAPLLAPNAILVTGSDSAAIVGRKAHPATWRREFAAITRMIYTRTPERIVASSVEPIAFEHGHWQGVVGTAQLAAGDYTAKWRLTGPNWVIEAELYLTLG